MLSKNTVVILGAGASMPYGFPSGQQLLLAAQYFQSPESLSDFIHAPASAGARPLFDALRATLDQSIDAMLETLPPVVVDAGKGFIARYLLIREHEARTRRPNPNIDSLKVGYPWIHYVWNALDLRSLKDFRANPIQFVTYNYDRSLEYALYQAITVKFPGAPTQEYREALDCICPIHLHGQLGMLPELCSPTTQGKVAYGGGTRNGPAEGDCVTATRAIRIVHEPTPQDEAFLRARDAIASAKRIIFLGFGYAKSNIHRLQLSTCLSKQAEVYLCATGFTEQQQGLHILPLFSDWPANVGQERYDIVEFFRHCPQALL